LAGGLVNVQKIGYNDPAFYIREQRGSGMAPDWPAPRAGKFPGTILL
jgi:hypothetical protein